MPSAEDHAPSMSRIAETQNQEDSLRYRLAAAHFYRIAKWLHFGGASLTVTLALVSPLVLLFRPSLGAADEALRWPPDELAEPSAQMIV
jgi:hypothetical protein